jgi:hypothetical protein
MDYINAPYMELKKECARLQLGGGGNREDLVNKLVAWERGLDAPEVEADKPKPKLDKNLNPTDPDPTNINYDIAGRWRRRKKGWLSWGENGKAIMKD